MKKQLLLLKLIVLCACTAFTQVLPTPPSGMKWEIMPKLSDEFNAGFDNSKWRKVLWNYGEPVNMVAENSGVSDGNLWIKATLGAGERWFNTSRIYSQEQIKFPVYTECSMKTAHISAFSTFWLNDGDINNRDEIDICEHNTNPSWPGQQNSRPYELYAQYFVVKNGVTERDHAPRTDTRNLSDDNPAKGKKWNEAYQALGCYWKDKNTVEFYINGEFAGKVTSTQDFTRSQNIIWDLWTSVHSWTGGIADKNNLSNDNINTMYVDWIHTYKLVVDDDLNTPGTVSFDDNTVYLNTEFTTGETLSVNYNFDAGSNARVDADGIKIWLREVTSNWVVVNDYTVNDLSVVDQPSGSSSATIDLQGVPISTSLPQGNFYFLYINFKNSRGEEITTGLNPINIVEEVVTGINQTNEKELSLFPNPVSNSLNLSHETSWKLYSMLGEFIQAGEGNRINLSFLSRGTYLVQIGNNYKRITKN